MYFTYVSYEERKSRDVNGRRKVENEERKGDRMAGKAAGEWNGKCEVGGRWVCGRAKQQDTLPSERWKAFQPESTLAQLCFLFGGGCGVAGRAGARWGNGSKGGHRVWVVGSSVVRRETERERERKWVV